jgi:hypothetical protein
MTRKGEAQPFDEPPQVTENLCSEIRTLLLNGEPPARVVRRLTRIVAVIAGDLAYREAKRRAREARRRRRRTSGIFLATTEPPGTQGDVTTTAPTAGSPTGTTRPAAG